MTRRHPLRAVADRAAACRQHPHRAAQFPVRAEAWRPLPAPDRRHRRRALDRRVRRRRSATISPGSGFIPTRCPPVGAVRPLRARVRAAAGGGPGLCLLRDPRRARPAPQDPARARACRRFTSGRLPDFVPPPEAASRTGASGSTMMRRSTGPTSSAATQKFDPHLLSDPVVRRDDGSWLYLLPSVIDDVDLGVTHIVRGEDHVSNSATQIQMFEALGRRAAAVRARGPARRRRGQIVEAPRLRTGSKHLREAGVEPMALLSLLARLGTSQPVEPLAEPRRAGRRLRLCAFRPGAGAFRPRTTSSCSMPACSTISTSPRSPIAFRRRRDRGGLAAAPRQSRHARRFRDWSEVLDGEIEAPEMSSDDRAFCAEAAGVAATIDWAGDPWHALADALKAATGRKGRASVPSPAPRADGPRKRPRNGGPAQAHRPGPCDPRGSKPLRTQPDMHATSIR